MQPFWLVFSDRAYRLLLKAYPTAFQDRFAMEMAQVFRALCREAYMASGAGGLMRLWMVAFWDWLHSTIYQWRLRLLKPRREIMQTTLTDRPGGIQPLSPTQAGLAALPFLVFGIASMVNKLEYFHTTPASLPLWQVLLIDPFLVFNWLTLIGLGAGILAGFPRWAFSYLGWALLFAWWWSDMGFYGYFVGLKIWLPLLGVFVLALLIRRSIQPLRALFTGIWKEWTLLFLVLYIFYASVFMYYDENHSPYLLAFIAATTLVMSLGAWGYFRFASALGRVLALAGGMVLTAVVSGISDTTWDFRAYYGLPESTRNENAVGLIFFAGLILVMVGVALLALRRQARNSNPK